MTITFVSKISLKILIWKLLWDWQLVKVPTISRKALCADEWVRQSSDALYILGWAPGEILIPIISHIFKCGRHAANKKGYSTKSEKSIVSSLWWAKKSFDYTFIFTLIGSATTASPYNMISFFLLLPCSAKESRHLLANPWIWTQWLLRK